MPSTIKIKNPHPNLAGLNTIPEIIACRNGKQLQVNLIERQIALHLLVNDCFPPELQRDKFLEYLGRAIMYLGDESVIEDPNHKIIIRNLKEQAQCSPTH